MLRYNILFGSLIITYFVWFNSAFVSLWVDSSNYIGESGNVLLCFVGMFTILCLSNEIFINSLQLFKQKSRILLITVFVFLSTGFFFSKQYGLTGIAISLLISKLFQWICYEILLQKSVLIKGSNVITRNYKTTILFLFILILRLFVFKLNIYTWFEYLIQSLMFFVLYALLVFLFILNQTEKKFIYHFFKTKFNA